MLSNQAIITTEQPCLMAEEDSWFTRMGTWWRDIWLSRRKFNYICIIMKDLLIGAITGAVIAIAILIWGGLSGYRNQKRNGVQQNDADNDESDPDDQNKLSLGTKLMIGALGAKLLDNQIEKHKKESEQRRKELFFWQDAIRDKEREEFGYEEDDWL